MSISDYSYSLQASSDSTSSPSWDPVLAASAPSFHALYVLFLYAYLSALQSLLWMTWSSVPSESCSFLAIGGGCDNTLDLWLDYGPIAFCLAVLPATALLTNRGPRGISDSIRVGLCLCAAAAGLRVVPMLLPGGYNTRGGILLVHIAQFLNGSVAPLAVATPAVLSLAWFSEDRRVLATAAANVANAAGRAVGFWLAPAIVKAADDVPKLLLLEFALALVPALISLAYCPASPAVPPSRAAVAAANAASVASKRSGTRGLVASTSSALGAALGDMHAAAKSAHFWLVAAAGGISMAAFGAWSGILPTVLTNAGFSPALAGALGAANTLAGCAGGLAAGVLADARFGRRWAKVGTAGLAITAAIAFMPLAWAQNAGAPTLLVCATLAGLLRGGTDPLFFELTADVAASSGASAAAGGGLLTLIYHVLLCAMLSLSPSTLQALSLPGMPIALILAALLLAPAKIPLGARRDVGAVAGEGGEEGGESTLLSH